MKKSLSSKLNKKIKKQGRIKGQLKPTVENSNTSIVKKENKVTASNTAGNIAKPVFNTDGKLVFSKFDFANIGQKGTKNLVNKLLDYTLHPTAL